MAIWAVVALSSTSHLGENIRMKGSASPLAYFFYFPIVHIFLKQLFTVGVNVGGVVERL